jgi:hypothetical protein
MSGEQLRACAIEGDHERLAAFLKGIANPCSSDEYGITPLMYAVWNGHIECVKYLVANDMGVNRKGHKCSALNEVSGRGYSALHLAALDCPTKSINEITYLLLSMNVNKTLKCSEGKTAYEIAESTGNTEFLKVWNDFEMKAGCDEEFDKAITELRNRLTTYSYRPNSTLFVKPWKSNFSVPKFIFQPQRLGSLPHGMHIHESHLEPLIDCGFNNMRSTNSIHCLEFSYDESLINEKRRKDLVHIFDENWIPPDVDKVLLEGKY